MPRITVRSVATVVAALLTVAIATPAHAETAYRYWSYWLVQDGRWVFAQEGPATRLPADGTVEAWRFAISTQSGDPALAPSLSAMSAFDEVCEQTTATEGSKRIAVIVDFGTSADAPGGATPPAPVASCATVDADATSMQALSSAFDLRIEDGLVCGIDGYPATGCAEIVDTAQMATQAAAPAVDDATDDVLGLGSSPLTAALTLAAIGLLAFVVLRRRT